MAIPTTPPIERRPAGRPRDLRVDAAIRTAALELLVDAGYNQLSIEGVARRAGVGKRTVYRRWPSKAHLVHDVVFPDDAGGEMPAETGDLATDLRRIVAGTLANFARPEARSAIPGLMAEFRDAPELHEVLTARLERRARAHFRELIARGAARGAVRTGVDADTVFDVIAGTIVFATQVAGTGGDEGLVDRVTDLVVHAVAAADADR